MAWKAVKTAEERHGEGLEDEGSGCSHRTSERGTAVEARGPTTIVEGIATFVLSQEVQGLYKCFWWKHWNITEVQRSLF
jgi:hypothetical protein